MAGKRHHFVPRFYLERFTNASSQKLCTYDMKNGTHRFTRPEQTGFEGYFYTFTNADGSCDHTIEELLADFESKAAPVFDRLIQSVQLKVEDRLNFSSFLALMYVRTHAFRRIYAEAMIGQLLLMNRFVADHPEAFEASMQEYEACHGVMTEKERDDLRDGMRHPEYFTYSVDSEWTLSALSMANEFSEIFSSMDWTILINLSDLPLITSDNPVIHGIAGKRQHSIYRGGFLDNRSEITFPLTPEYILLMHWNRDRYKRDVITAPQVEECNRMRAKYAERFLFSTDYSHYVNELSTTYKNSKPGLSVGNIGQPLVSLRRKSKSDE